MKDFKEGLELISNLAIVFGGLWALYIHYKRNGPVALKVWIDNIDLFNDTKTDSHYLNISSTVSNIGSRDVSILYNECSVQVSRLDPSTGILERIDKKTGLVSHDKTGLVSYDNYDNGRIRSKVEYSLPYLIKFKKLGMYFVELNVRVDITKYYKDHPLQRKEIKNWIDRKFYHANF